MAAARRMILMRLMFLLTLKYLHRRASKKRANRRWCVSPLWRRRLQEGQYNTLMRAILQLDPPYLKKYLRMSANTFKILVELVAPFLAKRRCAQRSISPQHRLAITLRYLATGDSYASVAFAFRVGITTVFKIVTETCEILWEILQPKYLQHPSLEAWEQIAKDYELLWNFPMCCGAVDGKHIVMQQPANTGSLYFNYKGTNSLVLLAVVDARCRYIAVDIGGYGSNSDGGLWNTSAIGRSLQQGQLLLPAPAKISGTNIEVPHVFVGDEAFQLRPDFMRPFPSRIVNDTRRIFNYRLSRARRCSECCFGITANRWRILRKPIMMSAKNAESAVKAIVVLHNFLMTAETSRTDNDGIYCPPGYTDYIDDNGLLQAGTWQNEQKESGCLLQDSFPSHARGFSIAAGKVRDAFTNYFMTEGAVPWQWNIPGLSGTSLR